MFLTWSISSSRWIIPIKRLPSPIPVPLENVYYVYLHSFVHPVSKLMWAMGFKVGSQMKIRNCIPKTQEKSFSIFYSGVMSLQQFTPYQTLTHWAAFVIKTGWCVSQYREGYSLEIYCPLLSRIPVALDRFFFVFLLFFGKTAATTSRTTAKVNSERRPHPLNTITQRVRQLPELLYKRLSWGKRTYW